MNVRRWRTQGEHLAQDAHHWGQICMLSRQLGHPLSRGIHYGLWEHGERFWEVRL